MNNCVGYRRMASIVVFGLLFGYFGSACATKNFVREEVQASARTLSTKIDNNTASINENAGQIKGNANQIAELAALNRQNVQSIETLEGDVKRVDGKASEAQSTADRAQDTAEGARGQATSLGDKFANRNRYDVLLEKVVYYKFNGWQLDDSYQADLIEVAAVLKKNPDAILTLEGHTDQTGDPSYNIQLGERRLDSVIRYLVVEQEVPVHKIHKMSFGEARPPAENDTSEGRSKNRCTIVRVLAPSL